MREIDPEKMDPIASEDEPGIPVHEAVWRAFLRGAVFDAMADKWGVTEDYAVRVVELMQAGRESGAAALRVCRYSEKTRQVYQRQDGKWTALVTHNPHDRTVPRLGPFASEAEALRAREESIAEGKFRIL